MWQVWELHTSFPHEAHYAKVVSSAASCKHMPRKEAEFTSGQFIIHCRMLGAQISELTTSQADNLEMPPPPLLLSPHRPCIVLF